jgi:hypothetical protein
MGTDGPTDGQTNQRTNQPTDQPTNGPTNIVSYRGATSRLKIGAKTGYGKTIPPLPTTFLVPAIKLCNRPFDLNDPVSFFYDSNCNFFFYPRPLAQMMPFWGAPWGMGHVATVIICAKKTMQQIKLQLVK